MNPEQWPPVKDLFHAALDVAPEDRSAFVAEACGGDAVLRAELERLLAAHAQADSFIEHSAAVAGGGFPDGESMHKQRSMTGRVIGRYEIGRLIGAGGMGGGICRARRRTGPAGGYQDRLEPRSRAAEKALELTYGS